MKAKIRTQSRRKTPWDNFDNADLTPMQEYLRSIHHNDYDSHHQSLDEMNDIKLFNSSIAYNPIISFTSLSDILTVPTRISMLKISSPT